MSCLSKSHRLNSYNNGGSKPLEREFKKIYNSNKKWHTKNFVIFYLPNDNFQLAFVASKKVGNAVQRNKARRKLRALALEYEKSLKTGKYIFVAKNEILNGPHKTLKKDFAYASKKLGLLK